MDILKLLKYFEGVRHHAYQDQGGIWTVGVGCTGPNIGPNTVWTDEQIDSELRVRVDKLTEQIQQLITVSINSNQLMALQSLVFNIGIGAFSQSHLLGTLNAGNYEDCAQRFLQWDHIGGQVNVGLLNRRKEEKVIFETPVE